jgi:hypothetical protein
MYFIIDSELGFCVGGNFECKFYIKDITRRREDLTFYLRVVKTIFYERAQRLLYSPKQKIV